MGIILRNAEVKLGYFYASGNETALLELFQVSKLGDVDSLILRLRTLVPSIATGFEMVHLRRHQH